MGTSTVGTAFSDQDLLSAVTQVWHASLRPDTGEPLLAGRPPGAPPAISAVVGITGAWHGHLRVDCGPRAAADISALLLHRPANDLRDNDVATAVARLATAVAGRITTLLPGPTGVCPPVVSPTGGAQHLRLPGCHETNRVLVAWQDDVIHFRVLQAESTDGGGTPRPPAT